jgi:hypothetical protein
MPIRRRGFPGQEHTDVHTGVIRASAPAAAEAQRASVADEEVTYIDIAAIPPPPDVVFEEPPPQVTATAPPPAATGGGRPGPTRPAEPGRTAAAPPAPEHHRGLAGAAAGNAPGHLRGASRVSSSLPTGPARFCSSNAARISCTTTWSARWMRPAAPESRSWGWCREAAERGLPFEPIREMRPTPAHGRERRLRPALGVPRSGIALRPGRTTFHRQRLSRRRPPARKAATST